MDHELTSDVWTVSERAFPSDAPIEDRARFLLRYAVLAPSSHNSQPWAFSVDEGRVRVYADETRWLAAADPDRRELHLSVGCAIENLLVAAERFGFDHRIEYAEDDDDLVATVTLDPADDATASPDRAGSFDAITERRTVHEAFEDRPVDPAFLDRLRATVPDGVSVTFVDDPDPKRRVGELQAIADERQMDDPAYRRELGHWIGNGALGASWLVARIGQVAVTYLDLGDREGAKNSRLVESAPVLALLTTPDDDGPARTRAGQAFERMALAATDEGLAVHPMSQTLERPETKRELAELVGVADETPQHLFRLGYADADGDHTPRWPVEAVLR